MARAKGLLEGELGEFLRRVNKEANKVMLDCYRCWKPGEHWPKQELYGEEFELKFDPRPDYAPTKELLRQLRKAGFTARVTVEEKGNYEYVTTADGYDIVDAPGTHKVYCLEIEW